MRKSYSQIGKKIVIQSKSDNLPFTFQMNSLIFQNAYEFF